MTMTAPRPQDSLYQVVRRSDGIVEVRRTAAARVTRDDAIALLQSLDRLAGGHAVPLLVDVRSTQGLDRESRLLFQQATSIRAAALLVDSPVSRVVANLFMGLNRPAYPMRLFNDEAEALSWLRGFLP